MNYQRFFLFIILMLTTAYLLASNTVSKAVAPEYSQTNQYSKADTTSSSFTAGLDQIVRNGPSHTVHLGVMVQSMQTGQILYNYNGNYLFQPASVQKLFTSITALAVLKPDFRFNTRLLTNGKIENGVLNGDLAVQFNGDPTLTRTDLANLLAQLKAQGIREITGHVYIDNSAYDNIPYPPGWFWDDLNYAFAAPLNAVILNENQFSIIITPSTLNSPAIIQSTLPNGVINVQNETITTNKYQANCPVLFYSDFNNNYKISGCIPRSVGKQYRGFALRDPVILARVMVQDYLQQNAIAFQGAVSVQAVNFNTVLAQHDSDPLYLIVKRLLKHSDNLITDAILKKIGQVYYRQGSWKNSVYAIENILSRSAGINFSRSSMVDGAGLSRYNLIAPEQLLKVLYFAYHQDQIIPYLLNALPIAGVDGTLRWRMPNLAKGQRVHAKTGTMKGVTALAGYVLTQNNGTLGVVVIVNGFADSYTPYRAFQDKICQYLVVAPRG